MVKQKKERLVILGCGYLGRAIVKQALEVGYAVTGLTRNEETGKALQARYGVDVMIADLAGDEWHTVIDPKGASIVLCVSSGGGGVDGYQHAYLGGAQSIAKWLQRGGKAKQIVYTGSTSVYPQTGGKWVDEGAKVSGSTRLNEILCATEAAVLGMEGSLVDRSYVLRLAGIYGPGRHYLIDQLRQGATTLAGRGDYYLNLIHRDDAAQAVIRALRNERSEGGGIYNISDGQPAEKVVIAEWTAKMLGMETPVFDPEQVNERAKRRALNPGGIPHRRICADKAKAELGWAPQYVNYEEGYGAILKELK